MSGSWKRGDRCTVAGHTHGLVAHVMAVADGYAMLRYPRCVPFLARLVDLSVPAREDNS